MNWRGVSHFTLAHLPLRCITTQSKAEPLCFGDPADCDNNSTFHQSDVLLYNYGNHDRLRISNPLVGMSRCQYKVTGWDRSHGLPTLSCLWQHLKLSDVSLGARQRCSLVVDEVVKKPTNQNNKQNNLHRLASIRFYY